MNCPECGEELAECPSCERKFCLHCGWEQLVKVKSPQQRNQELETAIKVMDNSIKYLTECKPNAVDTLMKFEDVRKQLRIWHKNRSFGKWTGSTRTRP